MASTYSSWPLSQDVFVQVSNCLVALIEADFFFALIGLTSSSLSHLPIHVSTNSFPGSLQSSRFHLLALFYFSLLAFFRSFLNISNLGCSMHCKRSKQNAGTLESRLQSGPECAPSFAALWLQLRNVNCEIALPVKVLSIVK